MKNVDNQCARSNMRTTNFVYCSGLLSYHSGGSYGQAGDGLLESSWAVVEVSR